MTLDLDDFREEYDEALRRSAEVAERARRTARVDRWATNEDIPHLLKALEGQARMIDHQRRLLLALMGLVK